jgi:DNA-binding MarR family transcriptional regulator
MAVPSPSTTPPPPGPGASPLFLREEEIRRGIELLHFGQAEIMNAIDGRLDALGLGRADQRVLYFIARKPDLTVSMLLKLLGITKQSLGRVLDNLVARGLVESRPGQRDRRQRLLRLTAQGAAIETELFETVRERMATAYSQAGQGSVTGFWRVLEFLIAPQDRGMVAALSIKA